MDHDAKEFFRSFFTELDRRALPYVILHSYHNFPDRIDSDIDYAVRDADIPKVHAALSEVASQTGWLIAQTLQYDIGSHYSVVVNPGSPGMFIKLDRSSHYTRNGCRFIPDRVLLEGRKLFNGFYIPAASSEFIYTLAKVFAKGKNIAEYLARLSELWSADPERSQKLFHQVFGNDAGKLSEWLDRPARDWNQLSAPMHARNRYPLPQRLLEWRRRLRRMLQPTGLRVTVAGENRDQVYQVISKIETLEEPLFRRTMRCSAATRRFSEYKAYRRSTLILTAARLHEKTSPRPDLIIVLNGQRTDPSAVEPDSVGKAAANAWREIATIMARREAQRWPSLRPKS